MLVQYYIIIKIKGAKIRRGACKSDQSSRRVNFFEGKKERK